MIDHNPPRPNKTDAGNGSKAICRVSNASRSPSPDPKRSPLAQVISMPRKAKQTQTLRARLATFLREHIVGSALFAITCSLVASYIFGWLSPSAPQPASSNSLVDMTIAPSPDSWPNSAPALSVTFVDGTKARVALAVTTSIAEEDTSLLVYRSGSREVAETAMRAPTEAAVFAELEKRTIVQARGERALIEDSLITMLRPAYKKAGITLEAISLKDFTE